MGESLRFLSRFATFGMRQKVKALAKPLLPERRTPAEMRLCADKIRSYKAARNRTEFRGCTQVNQIFLKANGNISCSCLKYWDILANAKETNIAEFFNGDLMAYIRDSFREGYEPFDFCASCPSRLSEHFGCPPRVAENSSKPVTDVVHLHVEPSSQCNLYCEACICTFERLSQNPPPRRNLEFATFEKLTRELHDATMCVDSIAFVGFGEPLFNSDVPRMARLSRALFPSAYIFLDTNGNFGERRAEEIADCGLNEIRLGIDGMDQASYETYRKRGDFAKAFSFARKLAASIRLKNSATRAVWKYILFRHNDRDDQILTAISMAEQIGLPIVFDLTVGDLASPRKLEDIHNIVGSHVVGCNIDQAAF